MRPLRDVVSINQQEILTIKTHGGCDKSSLAIALLARDSADSAGSAGSAESIEAMIPMNIFECDKGGRC
jgi:hypothetical protein